MALVKQPIEINFAKGLNTKADPYQVPIGNFLRLQNSTFDKLGRLTKRNGYGQLTVLSQEANFLTTFDGNLTAIGDSLQAYAQGSNTWVNKGQLEPISLSTLSLIRNNVNQTQLDTAISANNFICTVYTEVSPGPTTTYKYVLADRITGQNILPPAAIPAPAAITTAPRVFYLGIYFIIVYTTATQLRYVFISSNNPVAPSTSTTISSQITPDTRLNYDGVIANNYLYLAWNGSDVGGAIRHVSISPTLIMSAVTATAGFSANLMSVCSDGVYIYVSFWEDVTNNSYTEILNTALGPILAPTITMAATIILNITGTATAGVETLFYERPNNYTYDAAIPTHFIRSNTITVGGVVSAPTNIVRSVGLASKAFTLNDTIYFLAVYFSEFQPTYFLINSTGKVISRLAYSNSGGYKITGLPSVNVEGLNFTIGYQFQDLIIPVNKEQGLANSAGVYAQTGLNAVTYTLGTIPISSEIGASLNLTGGFLWMYDGYSPVENNFFVWPDNVEVTTAATGGFLADQDYFYQVIYEWTDNQGMIHRSAPSVPVEVTTAGGGVSANTIFIPTLRLTYKISNPVKIVIYRWSTAQQSYYQVTSVTSPLMNNTTVDSVSFVDTLSDATILGNSLIYTTGGVIENLAAPSFNSLTLFDNRLWGIDAEDPNLLWYSKQVIEATPVEMSDLFTLYAAPTTSAQGSTGDTKCLAPMDDKLILFKPNALYYINGSGPDNTGANSQYSQATFIAGTVGCSNQQSIVFTPSGLMFQSDKGIWLLNRGLGTEYIGAAVEDFTLNAVVQSAVSIPGTNQIRFTLDTGITLMYDYFVDQWGVFVNVPAISSTLYQDLHTYVDRFGRVFQETPGMYLDGGNPVLQGFTTGWIKAQGMMGFQRAYFMYLLGTYKSPHKLNIQVGYDYGGDPIQSTLVIPDNLYSTWGSESPYGSSEVWGGSTNIEQQKVHFERQKCESFQIVVDEVFDPSFGTISGEGLTLSGLNLIIGVKKPYPVLSAAKSFG